MATSRLRDVVMQWENRNFVAHPVLKDGSAAIATGTKEVDRASSNVFVHFLAVWGALGSVLLLACGSSSTIGPNNNIPADWTSSLSTSLPTSTG